MAADLNDQARAVLEEAECKQALDQLLGELGKKIRVEIGRDPFSFALLLSYGPMCGVVTYAKTTGEDVEVLGHYFGGRRIPRDPDAPPPNPVPAYLVAAFAAIVGVRCPEAGFALLVWRSPPRPPRMRCAGTIGPEEVDKLFRQWLVQSARDEDPRRKAS